MRKRLDDDQLAYSSRARVPSYMRLTSGGFGRPALELCDPVCSYLDGLIMPRSISSLNETCVPIQAFCLV